MGLVHGAGGTVDRGWGLVVVVRLKRVHAHKRADTCCAVLPRTSAKDVEATRVLLRLVVWACVCGSFSPSRHRRAQAIDIRDAAAVAGPDQA